MNESFQGIALFLIIIFLKLIYHFQVDSKLFLMNIFDNFKILHLLLPPLLLLITFAAIFRSDEADLILLMEVLHDRMDHMLVNVRVLPASYSFGRHQIHLQRRQIDLIPRLRRPLFCQRSG